MVHARRGRRVLIDVSRGEEWGMRVLFSTYISIYIYNISAKMGVNLSMKLNEVGWNKGNALISVFSDYRSCQSLDLNFEKA